MQIKYGSILYKIHNFPYKAMNIIDDKKIDRIVAECVDFSNYLNQPYLNPDLVYDVWYKIFKNICHYLGLNKKAAKLLWEELADVEVDTVYKREWYLRQFSNEVFGNSDRWSLLKLQTTHKMFRAYYHYFT